MNAAAPRPGTSSVDLVEAPSKGYPKPRPPSPPLTAAASPPLSSSRLPATVVLLAAAITVDLVRGTELAGGADRFTSQLRPNEKRQRRQPQPHPRPPCQHGQVDSLGHFATRDDKCSIFSPTGKEAVAYRVKAGVCSAAETRRVGNWRGSGGGGR
jgi:hypothetical protein